MVSVVFALRSSIVPLFRVPLVRVSAASYAVSVLHVLYHSLPIRGPYHGQLSAGLPVVVP